MLFVLRVPWSAQFEHTLLVKENGVSPSLPRLNRRLAIFGSSNGLIRGMACIFGTSARCRKYLMEPALLCSVYYCGGGGDFAALWTTPRLLKCATCVALICAGSSATPHVLRRGKVRVRARDRADENIFPANNPRLNSTLCLGHFIPHVAAASRASSCSSMLGAYAQKDDRLEWIICCNKSDRHCT